MLLNAKEYAAEAAAVPPATSDPEFAGIALEAHALGVHVLLGCKV